MIKILVLLVFTSVAQGASWLDFSPWFNGKSFDDIGHYLPKKSLLKQRCMEYVKSGDDGYFTDECDTLNRLFRDTRFVKDMHKNTSYRELPSWAKKQTDTWSFDSHEYDQTVKEKIDNILSDEWFGVRWKEKYYLENALIKYREHLEKLRKNK